MIVSGTRIKVESSKMTMPQPTQASGSMTTLVMFSPLDQTSLMRRLHLKRWQRHRAVDNSGLGVAVADAAHNDHEQDQHGPQADKRPLRAPAHVAPGPALRLPPVDGQGHEGQDDKADQAGVLGSH